jgi:ABC-2 type transport system permease protein
VKALLRAELIKLRTTRTFVVLTAAALAISLLVVVLTTTLQDQWTEEDDARDLFTADFTGLFILLLGVMGMAGEWRHRTITSTVLAAPRRLRLLSAKTISYAVAGIAISLIVTVTIMAIGTLILSARDLPTVGLGDLADVLWRNLVVAAYLGAFGVCIGGLIRNQIVAIVGLLLLAFAIEPPVIGLAPEVGKFGPTVGAPNGFLGLEDAFGEGDEQLTPALALLVMIGWVGLAFAAAAARLERRDLV